MKYINFIKKAVFYFQNRLKMKIKIQKTIFIFFYANKKGVI